MKRDMGASLRETGSRKPSLASRPGPSGFDPARRERPSQHGAALGEALADLAKAGGVGTDLLDLMCATCAFREGCMTNQMAATGSEALKCLTGEDSSDFACHHGMKNGQPTKLCAGFYAAKRAPFDVFKSTLRTLAARVGNLPARDSVREAFDRWAATHDPDGSLDDYERSRLYSKALAVAAREGENSRSEVEGEAPQSGAESATPKGNIS